MVNIGKKATFFSKSTSNIILVICNCNEIVIASSLQISTKRHKNNCIFYFFVVNYKIKLYLYGRYFIYIRYILLDGYPATGTQARCFMNKGRSGAIAINGILIALMIVMSLTMFLVGGMAFLPLMVLVVGFVICGKWTALILGFTFGLISLVSAYIMPTPTAPLFQNPLVSLVPRILGAGLAYLVYAGGKYAVGRIARACGKDANKYVTIGVSTALGTIFAVLFNTLLVLLAIWLIYNGKTAGDIFVNKEFIMGLVTINFVIEIIVTPIIAVPVVMGVDRFISRAKLQVASQDDLAEAALNDTAEGGGEDFPDEVNGNEADLAADEYGSNAKDKSGNVREDKITGKESNADDSKIADKGSNADEERR